MIEAAEETAPGPKALCSRCSDGTVEQGGDLCEPCIDEITSINRKINEVRPTASLADSFAAMPLGQQLEVVAAHVSGIERGRNDLAAEVVACVTTIHERAKKAEAERDQAQATLARVRELALMGGQDPVQIRQWIVVEIDQRGKER